MTALILSLFLVIIPSWCMVSPITVLNITQTEETCNLGNGTLTIEATGGAGALNFSIDGGLTYQSDNFFNNLESGDYLIVVTDGFSCTEFETAQIADAPEPQLTFDSDCEVGLNQANINLIPFDGISPYQYNWTGPNNTTFTTEDLSLIDPGEYFVTVTDALGCQIDSSIVINTCCELIYTCGLQDTILLDCISEIPGIDPLYLDLVSNNDEDRIAFELLGSSITNSCNDVIITAQDDQNNPSDCSTEAYIVTRTYTVDDGVSQFNCQQSYRVDNYESLRINTPAQDQTISCSDNISQAFNLWLSNIGGANYSICAEPLTLSLRPVNPQITYSCPGTGEAEVTFVLMDNCGNIDSTTARFYVDDINPPVIQCPADLIVEYNNPQNANIINDWLSQVSASDDCQMVIIIDDFDMSVIDGACELIEEVNFTATDECNNTVSCNAQLILENNINPDLDCPTNISIQCGDPQADQLIDIWLNSTSAVSVDNDPLPVIWDYDPVDFQQLVCGEQLEVNFQVDDDCLRNSNCQSVIQLIDNIAPNITCPSGLSINNTDPDIPLLILNWMSSVTAQDQCTDITISDDFDPAILNEICELDLISINFYAEDECNNVNECQSSIDIIRSLPSIYCPDIIQLECSDPDFEFELAEWINLAEGQDNSSTDITIMNDFNIDQLVIGCDETNIVNFSVSDDCNQMADCQSEILIIDTQNPIIDCPEEITIEILDSDYVLQIDTWLNSFTSADICHAVLETTHVPENLLDFICDESVEVSFYASDECQNISSCETTLHLINSNEIEVICPEPIELRCSHPQLSQLIQSYLAGLEYESSLPVQVSNDYDFAMINRDCEEIQYVDISFDVYDECNNINTCQAEITLIPDAKVYIPNIFSPDGDRLNDFFTLYGNTSVIEILNMTIYNRWGEKIFEKESFEPNNDRLGWDGIYKEKETSISVFTYHIIILDYFNVEHAYSGTIQLVR